MRVHQSLQQGEMEYKAIFAKSFSRDERRKLGYGAFIGCLILLFSFFTVFRPSLEQLRPILNLQLNVSSGMQVFIIQNTSVSSWMLKQQQQQMKEQESQQSDIQKLASQRLKQEEKPLQQHGQEGFISKSISQITERNESWRIMPYARKVDAAAMKSVTEFLVTSLATHSEAPNCTKNYNVPAIVFSVAGYSYNHFHAFGDILVPLFITSYQFQGEVQFLVTNSNSNWTSKYQEILRKLSRYEIINIDSDDRIHCFPSMIVGLKQHEEFRIDPSRSPNGYSMKDFREFLRSTYSLKRSKAIRILDHQHKKPRLLLVARKETRLFTNEEEIVDLAKSLGYEVIVAEPASMNLTAVARIVNSCDVMMGIHGAGLTNLVFLPSNAVLIQIIPLGGIKWWCDHYFGEPVADMDIRYCEYMIREEESTLIQQYPHDHAVFKDPSSFYKQGWMALKAVYLDKQNVKLDVRRFRATLLKALEHLRR
ncbi:hypothetical protein Sjap_021941 [Stephania japonica]|uniref:Glycosyltransferase 61 catalytic domain-containing protein n=1 Tax=Stephania japonica TaxID=461633 RepID=A0AAP0EWQ8_9MAGN